MAVKLECAINFPGTFDSVSLGCGLRFCILKTTPDNTNAVGP